MVKVYKLFALLKTGPFVGCEETGPIRFCCLQVKKVLVAKSENRCSVADVDEKKYLNQCRSEPDFICEDGFLWDTETSGNVK